MSAAEISAGLVLQLDNSRLYRIHHLSLKVRDVYLKAESRCLCTLTYSTHVGWSLNPPWERPSLQVGRNSQTGPTTEIKKKALVLLLVQHKKVPSSPLQSVNFPSLKETPLMSDSCLLRDGARWPYHKSF